MTELQTAPESLFWYWVTERHSIYLRREAGHPKPWTTDPILRDFKFTNPFRENDRGTVWLRENFLEPHREEHRKDCAWYTCDPEDEQCDCDNLALLAFNICWYRQFNWIGTGGVLGWQTGWDPERAKSLLDPIMAAGGQVFTGAHILASEPGLSKIDSTLKTCSIFWAMRGKIVESCNKRSLEHTFEVVKQAPYTGQFLAYEMVTDMRHTRLLEDATDIMTWANPGPGARRGLQRLELPWKPDKKAIESMRYLLSQGVNTSAINFDAQITMPALEMRDIEHSLCEWDKYCRVKFGEGQPRSRYPGA